jgi:RimJ/RimL family protein N-acetyltransferase
MQIAFLLLINHRGLNMLGDELLLGEFVRLTRITKEDLPTINEWGQHIEYLRLLSRSQAFPTILEDMNWLMEVEREENPTFAIRALEENTLVGICAFKEVRWQARTTYFWIGIGDPANRGRGYGTDATRVLLRYAFMEMNLNRVGLEVFSNNERAIASYKKVGFIHEGTVRDYIFRDGQYLDMHLMGMLRREWEALYNTPSKKQP